LLIESKKFTNGADKNAVKALFRKMSVRQLGGIKGLDFDGMRSLTKDNASCLAGCLNLCVSLVTLDLRNVGLDDDCMQALCANLANGALANLVTLNLTANQIGDEGMNSLSSAIASGAMANLVNLDLSYNGIGDEGMAAFASAIAMGALANLENLYLGSNQIGDKGMVSFADALKPNPSNPMGSLANLVTLALDTNQIGDEGMKSLSSAITSGALPALKFLRLGGNPGDGSPAEKALDARKK